MGSGTTPVPTTQAPAPVSTGPAEPATGPYSTQAQGLSGEEVLAMLTAEERDCMRERFGEELLGRIGELRITSRLANDPDSRFLFECITQESINSIGLALIAADAPISDETASCILEVLQENPDASHLRVGRLGDGQDVDAVHLLEAGTFTIQCLNDEEALATFGQMNLVLDQRSSLRGRDLLLMLSPSERSCVRDEVGDILLESIQGATVIETFNAAPHIFGCIAPDNMPAIFINVSASRMGTLSDETQACARTVLTTALESDPHPHLIEFSFGATGDRPEHYAEAIALSRRIFACMNDDELLQIQRTIADALQRE